MQQPLARLDFFDSATAVGCRCSEGCSLESDAPSISRASSSYPTGTLIGDRRAGRALRRPGHRHRRCAVSQARAGRAIIALFTSMGCEELLARRIRCNRVIKPGRSGLSVANVPKRPSGFLPCPSGSSSTQIPSSLDADNLPRSRGSAGRQHRLSQEMLRIPCQALVFARIRKRPRPPRRERSYLEVGQNVTR
jgi:hypothetical protein